MKKSRLQELAGIKKPLNEGNMWDRNEDGSIPTLADTTARYAAMKGKSLKEVDYSTMKLKSNIDQTWDSTDVMVDDLRQWIGASVATSGPEMGKKLVDALKLILIFAESKLQGSKLREVQGGDEEALKSALFTDGGDLLQELEDGYYGVEDSLTATIQVLGSILKQTSDYDKKREIQAELDLFRGCEKLMSKTLLGKIL